MMRWASSVKKWKLSVSSKRSKRDGARRRPGPAVALVDQDQIEIAVVAHLAAAELAQAEQDVAARLAGARPLRQVRHAEALRQRRILQGRDLHRGSSRPGRSGRRSSRGSCPCPGCRARRCAAAPCPGSCAGSGRDRRRRGTARPAPRAARPQVRGWFSTRLSSSSSIMPGLLMRISDRNWLQAHRSTYSFRLGGLKLNSSHRTALAAERGGHLFQVDQGHVGVGRLGQGAQQARGDAGQEVPAAARRQERHRLLGQLRQVLIRPCTSRKRIAAQDRADRLGLGVGVEDQVGLRLRLAVLALRRSGAADDRGSGG